MKQLVIVTGLSGSGKSIALRALEDSGYYCIDNLPATMLPGLSEHLAVEKHQRVAISVDSRSAGLEKLPDYINLLKAQHVDTRVLFLESNVETLVKRFSETRRKHPLSKDSTTLAESIAYERNLLAELGNLGHVIDTSNLSANTLRGWVKDVVSTAHLGLTLLFTSFGFKHGIPLDADFVFDVRCLPNPHYDPFLKNFTGKDVEICAFMESHPQAQAMLIDIRQYIEKWLPCFIQDNRGYLTVAIGCTGGQHRSVYFVEALSRYFKTGQKVLTRHRELKLSSE